MYLDAGNCKMFILDPIMDYESNVVTVDIARHYFSTILRGWLISFFTDDVIEKSSGRVDRAQSIRARRNNLLSGVYVMSPM